MLQGNWDSESELGAEVTSHHSTHNLLQIGDCLSLLPHLACRHKTGMGKEKKNKEKEKEKRKAIPRKTSSYHSTGQKRPGCSLFKSLFGWRHVCAPLSFPLLLSLLLSLSHTHTYISLQQAAWHSSFSAYSKQPL